MVMKTVSFGYLISTSLALEIVSVDTGNECVLFVV